MPTWWLIEDHLQGILRDEVMVGSEAPRGIGLPSRYAREAGLGANEGSLARGTGDFHESIYAGVVWTILPKEMTVLADLEWEHLETRETQVYEGLTAWFPTRVIF